MSTARSTAPLTALITGASSGIGEALARCFAREGYRLVLVARREGALHALAEALHAEHGIHVDVLPADLTRRGAAAALAAALRRKRRPVDVLVNNAGVYLWKPFLTMTGEDWETVLSTNLTATASFCRAALPGMIERRRGKIVNVSSVHGLRGDANLSAHSAAKFGVIGLTQSLAREFRSYNIAVNAVCPGTVDNRIDETANVDRSSPLSQKLWPRDVARTVLFLASDDAAGITGAALEVYGGTHLTIQA